MLEYRDMAGRNEDGRKTPLEIVQASHALKAKEDVLRYTTDATLQGIITDITGGNIQEVVYHDLALGGLERVKGDLSPFLTQYLGRDQVGKPSIVVLDGTPSGEIPHIIAVGFIREANPDAKNPTIFNGRGYTGINERASVGISIYSDGDISVSIMANREPLARRAKDIGVLLNAVAPTPRK